MSTSRILCLSISVILVISLCSSFSAIADNSSFLATAIDCKNYLVTNGFSYHKGHYEFPMDAEIGKHIDCSGYVSWAIYEYQGGNFECKSSKWYLQTAKLLYQEKESDSPDYTKGWTAVKGSENFQPGDILCYNGHVHIYYRLGTDEESHYLVLNSGSNQALKSCITAISEKYFQKAQYAIRLPQFNYQRRISHDHTTGKVKGLRY